MLWMKGKKLMERKTKMPRDLPSEWLLLLTLFSVILVSGCCSVPQLSTQGVTQCMQWNCTSINAFHGVRGLCVCDCFFVTQPLHMCSGQPRTVFRGTLIGVFCSVIRTNLVLHIFCGLSCMKNHVGFCNGGWVSGYMSWSQPGACNIDCFSLSKVFWTVLNSLRVPYHFR